MSRPRIAVTGAGHWHLDLFAPTLRQEGDIVGVHDPDPATATRIADDLGAAAATDVDALLRDTAPDFVLALGAHDEMAATARTLIANGTPFAMEKPCGLTPEQVHDIADRARDAGVFAAVPFVWRQSELLTVMRERFADTDPSYLSFRWIAGPPTRYPDSGCGWMLDPARSGGGCTVNLGVHFIDLARVLFGDDVWVSSATMSNAAYGLPVEDYSLVTLRSGGRVFVGEVGYLMPGPHSDFDMHFSVKARDHYVIATSPTDVEIVAPDGTREHITAHTTNVPHYPVFVRDALRRVREGEPPLASLTDMAAVMDLTRDAYALAGPLPVRPSVQEDTA
ncbi:Gfo/Idh/MocA family protein [Pseudonocardia sp. N23]|uniref:Gfo/Idh/MocA family protein n=1 Tax=Pseudonocardia sp. N23 TaxID=1987376 RepID=UPI000BFE0EAC|nr:Gfo/Idh/MocA family oxidoreductase [Pseudonocardia sp. N23]GAY11513.1 oxidoreductase, putative [Pseudonocardia sp. N23]